MVVLGGGPAGCASAVLLAGQGHDVALVRPTAPQASSLPESVAPSARRILEELGMLAAVERAGFHPNRGNVAWWADDAARHEDFPPDRPGFHTERGTLEGVLIGVARNVGVRIHDGMSARSAREDAEGWAVRCDGGAGGTILRARWVIDATGRRGVLARSEGREPDPSTTTLAIVRTWRRAGGWLGPDAHHTLVESYSEGWAWSVPLDAQRRCFTVMVDQRHADLSRGDLGDMLEAELARTRHVGPGREGAVADGDAWACPASLYSSRRFGRAGLLLAGDAGSFIDPLSSFGVKKALSSGWLAGVVAHTALIDAPLVETAVRFYDAREREVYRSYRAASVPFFESAAERHGTDYWKRRAQAAREAGGQGAASLPPSVDPDLAEPDASARDVPDVPDVPERDVRLAFDGIRDRPTLRAMPGTTLRTEERPGVEGQRITLREHLVSDAFPHGLRHVRGVDLRALVEVAPLHPQVPDGWAAYNGRAAAPVTLPDYLTALATAFAARFLEHGDE